MIKNKGKRKVWKIILGIIFLAVIGAGIMWYHLFGKKPSGYTELSQNSYTTQEIVMDSNGKQLFGVAYIPDTKKEEYPLVIISHGIGANYTMNEPYAEALASHGVAAYIFDFCGGGGSASEGDMLEMSVMTEVADLEIVLNQAKSWDFVNQNQIVLMGASQGSVVSSIVSARHEDEVAGEILCCPAYVIFDDIHEEFASKEDITDVFTYRFGIQLGRDYAEDIWDYDPYTEIAQFHKKVLLLHGDKDTAVDISYSKRAEEVYENAELVVLPGAGHMFMGDSISDALTHIFTYLKEIELI